MRRKVSERALEINVNEGLVDVIRRWSSVFSKTFIYGFIFKRRSTSQI